MSSISGNAPPIRRIRVHDRAEHLERRVRARGAPTGPLEPVVERPGRIDRIASDPCGEALLDGSPW